MNIPKNEDEKIQEVSDALNKDVWEDIGKQRGTSVKNTKGLFCFGCSHSIGGDDFPSGPSGERPCFFCVRNPNREQWQEDHKKRFGKELKEWYDSTPIAFYPMDAYQPIDMVEQVNRWMRKAKGDPNWNTPEGGIRFG